MTQNPIISNVEIDGERVRISWEDGALSDFTATYPARQLQLRRMVSRSGRTAACWTPPAFPPTSAPKTTYPSDDTPSSSSGATDTTPASTHSTPSEPFTPSGADSGGGA